MSGRATRIREAGDGATLPPTDLTIGQIIDGEYLKRDGDTIVSDAGPGGGGGAPTGAHYVTTQTDGTLSNEHVIDAPSDGIAIAVGAGTCDVEPANDLAEIEALTGIGIATRTGVETWELADAADIVAAGWVDPMFGYARDGNHTLAGNETESQPREWGILDLAGFNYTTAGHPVHVRELRNTGGGVCFIRNNGANSVSRFFGGGASGSYLGGGANGGSGGTASSAGSAGTDRTDSWPANAVGGTAGDGGNGGASGGGQAGGTGGNATASTAASGWGGKIFLDTGRLPTLGQLFGGAGGAGGGATAGAGCEGGGGGGGGGICDIHAYLLGTGCSAITIEANGGNGFQGTQGAGTGAGGGGGGGGGGARLVYQIETGGVPTVRALGGTGGAGAGTGSAGANGANGDAVTIRLGD